MWLANPAPISAFDVTHFSPLFTPPPLCSHVCVCSLWPQIMQEAIAHQVVEVVNRVHKRKHSARGISMAVMCAVACGMDLNEVHGDYIDIDDKMVKMVEQFEEKSGGLLRGGRFTKPGVEEIDQLPMQAMIGLQVGCPPRPSTSVPRTG